MPRRREVPKRTILPDPKFGDQTLTKFINVLMLDGKKSTAERIVYGRHLVQRAISMAMELNRIPFGPMFCWKERSRSQRPRNSSKNWRTMISAP